MSKKTAAKAALFARYSSSLQSELSLDAQVTEIEAWCKREGLEITHRYLLPETRSALVVQTDEFQDMVRAARKGEFQHLVVHKLDRFTRDRDIATTYKALLRRHGVQIRSVTENLGTSIHDRLIEGILEAFAEFYSLNLSAETKKGQRAATRAGRWVRGTPPYGYDRHKDEAGNTYLVENEREAGVIREVFRRYGEEGQDIQDILDYTEVATGKRWRYPTLQNRLKNKIYIGVLEYGKTSLDARGQRTNNRPEDITVGKCKALVDETAWNLARKRMGEHSTRQGTRNYNYLLSEGTMTCEHCGRPAVGQCRGRDKLPYYICSGWRDKLCTVEHRRSARADKLEEAFLSKLKEIVPEMDLGKCYEACQSIIAERQRLAALDEKEIQAELRELGKQKDNLMEFVLAGGATQQASTVNRKLRELESRENQLAEMLATARVRAKEKAMAITERLQDWFMAQVANLQSNPNAPEFKAAVRTLFKVSWNFQAKEGEIFMVPWFAEIEYTQAADLDPLPGCTRHFRSTQI